MTGGPGIGRALLATAALAALAAAPASAQRFAVELRAGAAVGNYTATAAGLDIAPAPSFGATVEARLGDAFSGYGGLTRVAFGCNEGFCRNRDMSLVSTGGVAGVRWTPGLVWARAGVAARVLRVSADGRNPTTTDPGVGWDLGAGVELSVAGFQVRPGLTYLRHGADGGGGDGRVAVLALEVGLLLEQ